MPPETFRSKIDLWLVAVMGSAAIAALLGVLLAVRTNPGIWPLALAISGGLPAWLCISTRYDLDDHTLHIRSGPFRWRVSIAAISAMTPTRNPLASPALSLDRLQILYGDGKAIMISPSDKAGFMRAINARKAATAWLAEFGLLPPHRRRIGMSGVGGKACGQLFGYVPEAGSPRSPSLPWIPANGTAGTVEALVPGGRRG